MAAEISREPRRTAGPVFHRGSCLGTDRVPAGRRHPVEPVPLRRPPGATGYVMKIRVDPRAPLVYVKLQLGAGKIIGRSFHYSEPAVLNDDDK